jgi:hypothetical protein
VSRQETREAVLWLCDALETFAKTCPASVKVEVKRTPDSGEFVFEDAAGIKLELYVYIDNIEVFYGAFAKPEFFQPGWEDAKTVLKICKSVRDGKVWEISSKSRAVTRVVFRLESEGPSDWFRDDGYDCPNLSFGKKPDWVRRRMVAWNEQLRT